MYFPAVELAVGARRELTETEIEQNKALSEVEEAIARGDANWTEKLSEKFGTPDFEAMLDMDNVMDDITKQLDAQLELEQGLTTNYD